MTIKTAITTTVLQDIELEIPSFFKNDSGKVTAFYPEELTVSVTSIDKEYRSITRCHFSSMYKPEQMISKGQRITEEQFNAALAEAILKISGVEICKEAPLSIAS